MVNVDGSGATDLQVREDGAALEDFLADDDLTAALIHARTLHPAELAGALGALDSDDRDQVLQGLQLDELALVIAYLEPRFRPAVYDGRSPEELQKLATTLPDDLAADMIQSLEPDVAKAVVAGLAPGARRRLEALAAYPPDSAAGRMTGQVFAIPESQTVAQTIVALRRRRPQAHRPFYTYVTDAAGRLTGIVSFNTLLFAEPDGSIADLMIEATSVAAETCRRPGRR